MIRNGIHLKLQDISDYSCLTLPFPFWYNKCPIRYIMLTLW